jgi:predicted transcriptional regulator
MIRDDPADSGERPDSAPTVSDARRLRAVTHPVRITLLGQMMLHGPLTATEAGELIGESPTTCSFHFRQLARFGFVEDAGGGKGRNRPWRMTSTGLNVTATDDPEARLAEGALRRLVRERQVADYLTWLQAQASYPRRWQDASADSAFVFYLTLEEMERLTDELTTRLMTLFEERMGDPSTRPAGSVPVRLLLLSHPTEYPQAGQAAPGREPGAPG